MILLHSLLTCNSINLRSFFSNLALYFCKSDRQGLRLNGNKIFTINNDHDIISDPVIHGSIQIPGSGYPIILMPDTQTTGGYPKIGVVISADYDKLVQLTPGSKIKFKKVELADAETLFKLYDLETQNLISQI